MNYRGIMSGFTAGELSPKMLGQVEFAQYQFGSQALENFIVWPQGMISRRPGTRLIAQAKSSTYPVRLIPFEFSIEQAYVLEAGHEYFRFYMDQGQIVTDQETLTLDVAPATDWAAGETVTGASSGVTALIAAKITSTAYTITGRSGSFTLGEILTNGADAADQGAAHPIVSSDDIPYELAHTYDHSDIFDVCICQSADIMFLAHNDYWPKMLSRTGHTSWVIEDFESIDGPWLDLNTDATKTVDLAAGAVRSEVTITGITAGAGDVMRIAKVSHGLADGDYIRIISCALTGANGGHLITDASTSADWFEVSTAFPTGETFVSGTYKKLDAMVASGFTFNSLQVGGLWRFSSGSPYGYVKLWYYTDSTHVQVEVIATSTAAATSAWQEGAWSGYRGFPRAVGFYENRLFWAGSRHQPQTLWASKTGDYYTYGTMGAATAQDDDPLALTLNSDTVNAIMWISGGKVLLVGTGKGQWHISASGTNEALTSSNLRAAMEVGLTSSPIYTRCDHTVLFWQMFGRNLVEVGYALESDSYVATPLTVLAEHIGLSSIKEMIYVQEPLGSVWCVREDGELPVLTYERQHKVVAWSRMTTDGAFESITHIPGDTRDEIWVSVSRTIGASTVRFIELFERLEVFEEDSEDWMYMDSALSYDGTAVTSLTGLSHLVGETVSIIADGGVLPDQVVAAGGGLTFDSAVSVVHAGLPYTSVVHPVPVEAKIQGMTIQNRRQRIISVGLRLYKSWACKLGPSMAKLESATFKTMGDKMDTAITPFTGDLRHQFNGPYDRSNDIYIVQDLPLPLNINALIYKIDFQA